MVKNQTLLSKELLRKFVAGELDAAKNEEIMAQLAEDEASLEFVDALWQEELSHSVTAAIPKLDAEQAQRVRRQIIQQIHRSVLGMNVVRMGTKGFGSVAVSLLRPFLTNKKWGRRSRRRPRGND